jgi:arginase family enzyme
MILTDFLSPVRQSLLDGLEGENKQKLGLKIGVHQEFEGLPDLDEVKVALIGVKEDRNSQNQGAAESPDMAREYLYHLYWGSWQATVADLGNIYAGETVKDTMVAVAEVIYQLLKKGIVTVIIGGTQDITYGNYRAYDRLEQTVNLAAIDAQFDLGKQTDALNNRSFLSHVVLKKPYILFNYSNLGYQTYFVNQEEIDLMSRMFFDVHRLGKLRANLSETEPILRDADIVSFDLSALRQSEAPGNQFHSPNGFTSEEACAIARYTGLSDKVTSFGIYECNPSFDEDGRTAHLIAQMIWYFLEGFNLRKGDYPHTSKKQYEKYTVLINEAEHELIFYKSPFSGRWWIEVPVRDETQNPRNNRHKLIPCSYQDYQEALQNEIPERWWSAMKKSI